MHMHVLEATAKSSRLLGLYIHMSQNVLRLGRILKFGFEQICHEYSNIGYWITSGMASLI